ncbi:MAG: bifunctional precorrin-2 dehydrogenase/sirohydrochlorin ferrochelatase [Candidatus Verstraetearchaeota archaeon]|nr:bifunctional precorrin-2 dehydrogenase/sirohydrochlorin ferrochelatase [Candidatus Verstraetearchaeota archaeon]
MEERHLVRKGMLVYISTEGFRALVVGSGRVGRRKIYKLIEAGAEVTVVTKEEPDGLDEDVKVVIGDGLDFAAKNIDRFDLVVAATNDPQLNSKISELAKQKGKLVNSVTSQEECNVMFPAILDYGKFQLGVTTRGEDPSLSKRIKKILQKALRQETF